jgi:hypothetical protein
MIKNKPKINPQSYKQSLYKWETILNDVNQLSKWISLYNAVNIIADKCDEMGVDFNTIELGPLKIREYMDSTTDIIYRKLLNDIYKIEITPDNN